MEINTDIVAVAAKEKKLKKGPGVSDTKQDGQGKDIIDTSDYKITNDGRKYKAHRIVFNKGQDDGQKGVTEQMKKSFSAFVEQHTADLTEEQLKELEQELNEVLGKSATAGDWIHDFVHSDDPKFKGKSKEKRKQMALAAYYAKQRNEETEQIDEFVKRNPDGTTTVVSTRRDGLHGNQHKLDKNKNGKLDAQDFKMLRKEDWDDMLKAGEERRSKEKKAHTATAHDVKITSTGTEYTKQQEPDGTSKEFKRDPDAPKRGRGRPKKSSFGEAVEFLMNLDEATFDYLMEEGFDAFIEQYEQLDELSKTTLASYAKHAAVDAKFKGFDAGHQQGWAMSKSKELFGGANAGAETDDKAHKRLRGVKKAIDRLVK